MRTVAFRFAENFAPACGTIAAHRQIIDSRGLVWFGKLGTAVSPKKASETLGNDEPRILLIHSGGQSRWWAYIVAIQRGTSCLDEVPECYRDKAADFGCWFKVVRFDRVAKDVMSRCVVASSGRRLAAASRHSMNPYFIIDHFEEC